MIRAVKGAWVNLEHIKNPTEKVIKLALEQAGWAIKYVNHPSEELQLLAISKNYDALKFIKEPYNQVQEAAVKISYDALRYIKSPTNQAELIAIHSNAGAIKFISDLDKHKILEFLKVNFLIIKYTMKEISKDELEKVLKEVLAREEVEEQYIRDFLNYNTIDQSIINSIDKMDFIYRYGSKRAKKIAVDEKLKMK
ncbi:MAG: hypothetical protein ACERKZ_12895, partial [Lachnotalea sp.]